MSEKPDKLIPRLFRFTEDDIRKLKDMGQYFGAKTDAEAIRESLRMAHAEVVEQRR